jgi:AraC-like DNA-binding protein
MLRFGSACSESELRSGTNVDSVARPVGYQCTKNFYRAVRRLTGHTPGQLRALPAEQAGRLAETIAGCPEC